MPVIMNSASANSAVATTIEINQPTAARKRTLWRFVHRDAGIVRAWSSSRWSEGPTAAGTNNRMESRSIGSNVFCVFACLIAIAVSGCSSGGLNAPTTVLAQSAYSAASLSGTYAFQTVTASDKNTPGLTYEQIGTLTFDGSGNVTGGTSTAYFSGTAVTCTFTFSGTYTVQSSGAGTVAVTLTPTSASVSGGCTAGSSTSHLAVEVAGGGSTFEFADTDGNIFAGNAAKQ